MRFRGRRVSVTAVGWLGAAGTVVLVAASRLDLLVVAIATPFFAFFVLAALLSSPTHRADVERGRTTIRSARRLTTLLEECSALADRDAVADRVAAGLVDMLELEGCWFEPGETRDDLPVITPDGEVTARVQRQLDAGLVLPPVVSVPIRGSGGPIGRFVLESNPTVGVSPERRMLAVAMAHVIGMVHSPPGEPRVVRPLRTPPPAGRNG